MIQIKKIAKISALSSGGELEKYEYLTGEDLRYKPYVIQKTKFEYSPLGKVFNKGLGENNKKEGFLKRLRNIEGKDEEQLNSIEEQGEKQLQILDKKTDQVNDFKKILFRNKLNSEAKKQIKNFKNFNIIKNL